MISMNISNVNRINDIKKLKDSDSDIKEVFGEDFSLLIKNVVYENIIPHDDIDIWLN